MSKSPPREGVIYLSSFYVKRRLEHQPWFKSLHSSTCLPFPVHLPLPSPPPRTLPHNDKMSNVWGVDLEWNEQIEAEWQSSGHQSRSLGRQPFVVSLWQPSHKSRWNDIQANCSTWVVSWSLRDGQEGSRGLVSSSAQARLTLESSPIWACIKNWCNIKFGHPWPLATLPMCMSGPNKVGVRFPLWEKKISASSPLPAKKSGTNGQTARRQWA